MVKRYIDVITDHTLLRIILFLTVLVSLPSAYAQTVQENNIPSAASPAGDNNPSFPVYINTSFNTKDIMVGIGTGYFPVSGKMFSLRVSGFARPYKKTVFVEKSANSYYQLKERRYGLDAVCDYTFFTGTSEGLLSYTGLFAAVGYGITGGSYAGVDFNSRSESSVVVRCGIQMGIRYYVRAGYQYFKMPNVPPNRLFAECGIAF